MWQQCYQHLQQKKKHKPQRKNKNLPKKYDALIKKQLKERLLAFNRDCIQHNDKEFKKFTKKQREEIRAFERERSL